jgi:CHASE2 domain-containing sensor protein
MAQVRDSFHYGTLLGTMRSMAKPRATRHGRKKMKAATGAEDAAPARPSVNSQGTEPPPAGAQSPPPEPPHTPWRKVFWVSTLTSLLLFLALHTDLFGLFKFDDFINRQFIAYTEAYVEKPISGDIAILTIETEPQKNGGLGDFGPGWRQHYRQLIDALSEAGARVVAFDMYFEDVSPESDESFGEAIQRARLAGTSVVLGARNFLTTDDEETPQMSPRLARYLDRANWGLIEIGGQSRDSILIRQVRLAQSPPRDSAAWLEVERHPVIPSLPLRVAMQFWAGREPVVAVFDKGQGNIDVHVSGRSIVKSVPVGHNLDFIFDVTDKNTLDAISFPFAETFNNLKDREHLKRLFGGKIVLVGVKDPNDLRQVSHDEKRYGVEILASVTSNLLLSFYIRPLPDGYQYLLLLLMCVAGALLGTRFRNWLQYKVSLKAFDFIEHKPEIPVALGVVGAVYLLTAFFVYVQTRYIFSIPYHLAALVLTFYLIKALPSERVS